MEWSLHALLGPGNYFDTFFFAQRQAAFGQLYRGKFPAVAYSSKLTPFSWKNDIKMSFFSLWLKMPQNLKHFLPKDWRFLDGKSGLSKK
jgi:hypothetical protein